MGTIPRWTKQPPVVAAIIAGMFAIVVALLNMVDWKPMPDIIVQTGGLYLDSPNEDGSWQVYVPKIHKQERFWIGLNVLPRKDITVDVFSVGGVEFKDLGSGYMNQVMKDMVELTKGKAAWIAVPIEPGRWEEFRGILSSKTICLLLDINGKAIVDYELPASTFPQE
jgi:hypothetical protein